MDNWKNWQELCWKEYIKELSHITIKDFNYIRKEQQAARNYLNKLNSKKINYKERAIKKIKKNEEDERKQYYYYWKTKKVVI
jgi:hypothetical protein